ncbi:MAG: 5'/3'-nucleotidase SurE [Helicobacteraceae bacterium]|jgi:5'-nucleotidase|nr:5'/3'-nucleotidase SurE [Helicobacteraceae bacterium]
MKEILITNDDGYEANGLKALIDALRPIARLTIVAPASEKSSCGHSLTLTRPLKFISVGDDFYKLDDGSPSDCVYLALNSLFSHRAPDLIVSGINHGANLGEDTIYSGTVAAAMEAVLHNVPAIAISQYRNKDENGGFGYDFELAAKIAREVVEKVFAKGFPLPPRQLLNINIPHIRPNEYKGLKITRASRRVYHNDALRGVNPRGEEYFWLGAHPFDFTPTENGDYEAIIEGYASITPIMCDLTAYRSIETLDKWI